MFSSSVFTKTVAHRDQHSCNENYSQRAKRMLTSCVTSDGPWTKESVFVKITCSPKTNVKAFSTLALLSVLKSPRAAEQSKGVSCNCWHVRKKKR